MTDRETTNLRELKRITRIDTKILYVFCNLRVFAIQIDAVRVDSLISTTSESNNGFSSIFTPRLI